MILVQTLVKDLFNMKKDIFLRLPIDDNVLWMYDPE